MTAGKLDIIIEQGATFSRVLTWKDEDEDPVNLTGYSARMQAREHQASTEPFIDLTTANGGITLGGSGGTITLSVAATITGAIAADSGVYDLELESASGIVTRLLEGNVIISKNVTRA